MIVWLPVPRCGLCVPRGEMVKPSLRQPSAAEARSRTSTTTWSTPEILFSICSVPWWGHASAKLGACLAIRKVVRSREGEESTVRDVIDEAAGLPPESPLAQLRRRRPDVVRHAQGSYEAVFEPADDGGIGR